MIRDWCCEALCAIRTHIWMMSCPRGYCSTKQEVVDCQLHTVFPVPPGTPLWFPIMCALISHSEHFDLPSCVPYFQVLPWLHMIPARRGPAALVKLWIFTWTHAGSIPVKLVMVKGLAGHTTHIITCAVNGTSTKYIFPTISWLSLSVQPFHAFT